MTDLPLLPSNFVVYNHDDPSPLFPPDKLAYIESIHADFSEEDLKRIRAFERFALNRNTGGVGGDEIPGLRNKPGEDHLYVKRFSDAPWKTVIRTLMERIPDDFPDEGRRLWPLCRMTLPSGDRYYPITFLGDLDAWKQHLQKAAADCGTQLGRFEKGKFVLPDGQSIGFSDLRWDRLLHKQRIPGKW